MEKQLYVVELSGRDSYVALFRLIRELCIKVPKEDRGNIYITVSAIKTPLEQGRYCEFLHDIMPKIQNFVVNRGFVWTRYLNNVETPRSISAQMAYKTSALWSALSLSSKDEVCIGCHMYCHVMHALIAKHKIENIGGLDSCTIVTGERIKHGDKTKVNQSQDVLDIYQEVIKKTFGIDLYPILKNEDDEMAIYFDVQLLFELLDTDWTDDIKNNIYICPVNKALESSKFTARSFTEQQKIEHVSKYIEVIREFESDILAYVKFED